MKTMMKPLRLSLLSICPLWLFLFATASPIHAQLGGDSVRHCFTANAGDNADAFLNNRPSQANVNFGTHPDFLISAWTVSGEPVDIRELLRFDELATLPPGTIVLDATLYLYFNPISLNLTAHSQLSGSNDAYCLRVLNTWDESTVTWNSQPTAAATSSSSLVDKVDVPGTIGTQNFSIPLTEMVQFWVDNPADNHGMKFQLVTEDHYRGLIFASSDHPDSALHPVLCVTVFDSTTSETASASEEIRLQVNPNPLQEGAWVSLPQGLERAEALLINSTGQAVWSGLSMGRRLEIPATGLPAGVYFLSLTAGNRRGTARIVIQ